MSQPLCREPVLQQVLMAAMALLRSHHNQPPLRKRWAKRNPKEVFKRSGYTHLEAWEHLNLATGLLGSPGGLLPTQGPRILLCKGGTRAPSGPAPGLGGRM